MLFKSYFYFFPQFYFEKEAEKVVWAMTVGSGAQMWPHIGITWRYFKKKKLRQDPIPRV